MVMTLLDKSLNDLRREISDMRQVNIKHDYDINKLTTIITNSRDSLRETETFQHNLLQQLQQFEKSLADVNQMLRTNAEKKEQLEQQQQSDNDIEIRAKLMALNAEALECRATSIQLQQEVQMVLARAVEIEKRANDELAQQATEMQKKQQEIERNRAVELERRVKLEEERQRLKELQIQQQQQQQQQRLAAMAKLQQQQQQTQPDEYADWKIRDFMHNDQNPQCIVRVSPNFISMPIEVTFLKISETENLLDNQEELISTPLNVNFNSSENEQQMILLAIPYIVKRSSHRENIVKIRQSNGLWISIDTNESTFDSYKDKRFVECKLTHSAACAVVSRLKRDKILINKKSSDRFSSTADPRLTIQWPMNVSQTDLSISLRIQPVDLATFTHFTRNFSHESQGLLAVGPIIDFHFDELNLLKPIELTFPILVQGKKPHSSIKPVVAETTSTTQPTQQEIIFQQQQAIFKSMLGENSTNEQLFLLYSGHNENLWHLDTNVNLIDSKTHDLITANMKYLYDRMIIARCDKQLMSTQQLQKTISLLENSLNQRSASFILRHRLTNPNEICLVCCSSRRTDLIDHELEQESFTNDDEQSKAVILQEGQLLELRFRGNVLPNEYNQQSHPFAFNTYYPFYFQTNVIEIDKYSQHFSPFFYGFVQIFSKQKVLRTVSKEIDKKKQIIENTKQEWVETDVCIAELVIRLPKQNEEIRTPIQKTLATFASEGILTPTLFRDMSTSLAGDEWRRLARRLGITRIRIEAIDHDYRDDAGYYMLFTWFKRVPRSSDKVTILVHALMNINRWDLAQDLQTMQEDKRQEQRPSSKDELLKQLRVPFNLICQRDECVRIWKQIARELMLTNEDIERIEQKCLSKQERCLRSLEHWAFNDIRADVINLARIIRSLGFKSLAREIESMA